MSNLIQRIDLEKLRAHPENPNEMRQADFTKLRNHIKETGLYEPIVVRRHPSEAGEYEIINGHHRVEVLRELGENCADCVVWDTDDDQTRILLATLNRLGGSDEVGKKLELYRKLSETFDSAKLSKMLSESREKIDKLLALNQASINLPVSMPGAVPEAVVFFLSGDQKAVVERAIESAAGVSNQHIMARVRAEAIAEIASAYIES